MRVLFLTSTFHPTIGGAETYAINLSRGLAKLGHTVRIATDAVDGQPDAENLLPNMAVARLNRYRATFRMPDRILWEQMQFGLCDEMAEVVDEFKPNVIVSNSLDLCSIAKLISLKIDAPWIATFHEQAPEREPLGAARVRLAYEFLRPDAIIAGSQFYLARARKYARADISHLIYHGIDADQFRPLQSSDEVRAAYNVPAGNKLIISAGRIKPRKGFADLLQAVAMLRRAGRHLSVIIAGSLNSGSAAHKTALQTLVCELELSDAVTFDNAITHDRMPWLLSAADIVVQASLEEGLGLAVLEAMACGKPVVTTRIPGIVEVANDDVATLIEPAAPIEVARAIDDLLMNEQLRHRLGTSGRAHVLERFSVERMAASTATLLRSALQRGSASAFG